MEDINPNALELDPNSALVEDGSMAAEGIVSSANDADVIGRPLKFVVTVQPLKGLGYRAILALGTESCDPLVRSVEALGWPDLFEAMRSLLADAEVQWRSQPRYPTVSVPKAKTVGPGISPTQPASTPPISEAITEAETNPVPLAPEPLLNSSEVPVSPKSAPSGQLSLFG